MIMYPNEEQTAMGSLLDSLTGNNIPTPKRGRPKSKTKSITASVVVDEEQWLKIRAIADRESVKIKDVLGVALQLAIDRYEESHGPVRVRASKRGNVNDIFNL